jgi:hypothetical protein
MQQQGRDPVLHDMDARSLDEQRRDAAREALAQPSASAERHPHIFDPIRRLLRAIRKADR